HGQLRAAPACRRIKTVASLVGQRARIDLVALGRTGPAAGREHDRDRLADQQLALVNGLRRSALDDLGATFVAEFLGVRDNHAAQQLGELGLAGQYRLETGALFGELRLLFADFELLELGQVAQPGIEDRVGLLFG